jgi:DNA mismatch repair protein MutS
MVEMSETAELLEQAGPNSLIILDEIGRGTSTYDGLSLAQAILEELLYKKASFMFSTHYQELTTLADKNARVQNRSMGVKKDKDKIFFEYVFKNGAAEKSYGIEVAKIAGLKQHVIQRATELLEIYEAPGLNADAHSASPELGLNASASSSLQLSFLDIRAPDPDPKILELIAKVKSFATNEATPLEALNEISKWQKNL